MLLSLYCPTHIAVSLHAYWWYTCRLLAYCSRVSLVAEWDWCSRVSLDAYWDWCSLLPYWCLVSLDAYYWWYLLLRVTRTGAYYWSLSVLAYSGL